MNPLALTLRNCRTYDELHLEIPEGLLAIIGDNGAGKSTLINAIDVALFGPESRSLADWYPRGRISDAPLQIELVFEHAGLRYRVRRTYSPKGRGQSKTELERENGYIPLSEISPMHAMPDAEGQILLDAIPTFEPITVESQSATNDQIEALIGLSRPTFRASSFLAQGDTGRFAEAPARERKRVLAEIVGADEWQPLLERARAEAKEVNVDLLGLDGRIAQAEQEIAERIVVVRDHVAAQHAEFQSEADLGEATARLTIAREALSEAEIGTERRRNAQNAVQRAERDLSESKAGIQQRADAMLALNARLDLKPALEQRAAGLPRLEDEQESLRMAIAQWRERERIEREAAAALAAASVARDAAVVLEDKAQRVLAGIGAEHCDRCGQILGHEAAARAAESFRDEAKQKARDADEGEERVALLHKALVELPSEQPDESRVGVLTAAVDQARAAASQLAALAEAESRRDELVDEVRRMRAGLPEREEAVAAARAELDALGPHDPDEEGRAVRSVHVAEVEVQRLDGERVRAAQDSARLAERLERLNAIAADLAVAQTRREELQSELDLLVNMEKACGANGVPALILETIAIPQVEVEASRILGLLGGPAYACELRTLREKKTGGIADTLDIVLLTDAGEAPYETFSGGERARISFALRLALAQLLAARKGSATGLLVIDEVEGLDAQGMAALVGVLEELQRSVPRIIVVSHVAELRDAFANTMVLENVDGRSRIVNGAA